MSITTDYIFNNLSRMGDDFCSQDINSIQNSQSCSYLLQNYYNTNNINKTIQLATSQPCINYSGSFNNYNNNIDTNIKLLVGSSQTKKQNCNIFHRPYSTIPYLGRGSVCPIMESQILQGELISNRKSVNCMTEKTYYHNIPLLPKLKKSIQNPNNLIENNIDNNWIRGGLPSRELTKDVTL